MKENEKILDATGEVLKPIEFKHPSKNPKLKINVTERDIKALRKFLKTKQHLEKKVFPKMEKITFSQNLQPT